MKRIGRGLVVLAALLVVPVPAWAQGADTASAVRTLTLDDAIRQALRQNLELEGSRLELQEASDQVREAWGEVYPSVNLTSSFTRSLSVPGSFLPRIFVDPTADPDELIAVKFGADNSWSMQLRADQPIFDAAVFVGLGAAGRYESLQFETVRGTTQEIVTRTRLAYYDVLLAREALRLSENSVRRVRQVLEETEAMNRAGLASDYDVLRLRVELANLEPNLRRARNTLASAVRSLAVELDLDAAESFEVVGTLAALGEAAIANEAEKSAGGPAPVDPEAMAPEEVIRLAKQHRSDLRQLELTEQLRQTELRLERVEYLPKVSVFGTYSINAQQNGSPDFFGSSAAQRAYGRQIGVQVTMPVFSGFQRPARLAQKRAILLQAQRARELASARAENEVRTLVEQAREARARADAQRLAVEQAERGFQIATTQYREGVGSQLEVTDAEIALRQSEYNFAEAMYDFLVARARLDVAAGLVPFVDTGDRVALER